ncbi:SUMF1/EgtB/PvdO family nonheme iron enzyme [Kiritimatiellota bacterium B12222]|nr:SUMF1/EgtB/PvdO family nonheme iron enzyme [Kiritimatiellota bacterium B12222]
MKSRSAWLLLFPIFGSMLAWVFRPSEVDWIRLEKPQRIQIKKKSLPLPTGESLRFIHVPHQKYAISVLEVPEQILALYPGETYSHAGATAFAAWLSEQSGHSLRLPTRDEWRDAARAGIPNAEFAWGFGPPLPPPDLHFALAQAPRSPGPAFGYGFRDLAGGKWEWTQEGLLLGSAWTEQNPQTLYIDYQLQPPKEYAGADTAIRLLWEE